MCHTYISVAYISVHDQVKYKKHKKKALSDKKKSSDSHQKGNMTKYNLMQHVAMIPTSRSTLSVCSAPAVINGHSSSNRDPQVQGYSTDDDASSEVSSRMPHSWRTKLSHQLCPEFSRLISELIECEKSLNIVNYKFPLNHVNDEGNQTNTSKVLCDLGDNIVCQLVQWMRHLPFYTEIPLPLHTKLLTKRWHEILLLTMAVHQPSSDHAVSKVTSRRKPELFSPPRRLNSAGESMSSDSGGASSSAPDDLTSSGECSNENSNGSSEETNGNVHENIHFKRENDGEANIGETKSSCLDFSSQFDRNMEILHTYMTRNLHRNISLKQMTKEVGVMMEKVTFLIRRFHELKLSKEEYVCLKIILLLNHGE